MSRSNRKPPRKERKCSRCKIVKKFDTFRKIREGTKTKTWEAINNSLRYVWCRQCESEWQKEKRDKKPALRLFLLSRRRARRDNLNFDITEEYIKSIWPKDNKCPLLRTEFKSGMKNKHVLPSLDKVVRKKGYVKGNVQIISYRANQLKSDIDDFEIFKKLYEYCKKNS